MEKAVIRGYSLATPESVQPVTDHTWCCTIVFWLLRRKHADDDMSPRPKMFSHHCPLTFATERCDGNFRVSFGAYLHIQCHSGKFKLIGNWNAI